MTKDEALKLALDVFGGNDWHEEIVDLAWADKANTAITAIKEALAQPDQGPVIGTKTWFEDGKMVTQHLTAKDIYKEPKPVIDKSAAVRIATSLGWEPKRKPLTDEEIILIVADCASSHQHTDIHFARAIEAAHGIKE